MPSKNKKQDYENDGLYELGKETVAMLNKAWALGRTYLGLVQKSVHENSIATIVELKMMMDDVKDMQERLFDSLLVTFEAKAVEKHFAKANQQIELEERNYHQQEDKASSLGETRPETDSRLVPARVPVSEPAKVSLTVSPPKPAKDLNIMTDSKSAPDPIPDKKPVAVVGKVAAAESDTKLATAGNMAPTAAVVKKGTNTLIEVTRKEEETKAEPPTASTRPATEPSLKESVEMEVKNVEFKPAQWNVLRLSTATKDRWKHEFQLKDHTVDCISQVALARFKEAGMADYLFYIVRYKSNIAANEEKSTELMYGYEGYLRNFSFKQEAATRILATNTIVTDVKNNYLALVVVEQDGPNEMRVLNLQAVFPFVKEFKNLIKLSFDPYHHENVLSSQKRKNGRFEFLLLQGSNSVIFANSSEDRSFTTSLGKNHFWHSTGLEVMNGKIIDLRLDSFVPESDFESRIALLVGAAGENPSFVLNLLQIERTSVSVAPSNVAEARGEENKYEMKSSSNPIWLEIPQKLLKDGLLMSTRFDVQKTRMIYNSELDVLLLFLVEHGASAAEPSSGKKKNIKVTEVAVKLVIYQNIQQANTSRTSEPLTSRIYSEGLVFKNIPETTNPKLILKSHYDPQAKTETVVFGAGKYLSTVKIARHPVFGQKLIVNLNTSVLETNPPPLKRIEDFHISTVQDSKDLSIMVAHSLRMHEFTLSTEFKEPNCIKYKDPTEIKKLPIMGSFKKAQAENSPEPLEDQSMRTGENSERSTK